MNIDYSPIPERIINNIIYYSKGKELPSGLVYALLSNNLFESIARADSEIRPIIPLICHFILYKIPPECWGNDEIVDRFIQKIKYQSEDDEE